MDGYETVRKLGEGGYSEVYKIRDKKTGKSFALKRLKYANNSGGIAEDELKAYKSLL